MEMDLINHRYLSKRSVHFGKNGMAASSHPYAAQAGLKVMKKGGNAIDAAIAVAATLTVVEPTANGIGGDAFVLVWAKDKLYGLNSSGFAPELISIEKLKELGHEAIPTFGVVPVTVPGVPAAWAELSQRFGKLSLYEALEPAIRCAREGVPVAPMVAKGWKRAINRYLPDKENPVYEGWFQTFSRNYEPPSVGEVWKLEDHARTLEEIGKTNARSFYEGELADKIDEFFRRYDGFLRKSDLMKFKPEWVEPLKVNYRGYDVWEIPPNGQGIVALMALNILKGFDFCERENVETVHKHFEAMKLAFTDGKHYISEPKTMRVKPEELLSEKYAEERRGLIGDTALTPVPGEPPKGGTVYLATADGEGNMVSYIQSNYMGFGSGVVIPGTGIAMQNRGNNFSFDSESPNALGPFKRPYHTIIPGFLTKDGKAVGPFGVMGGFIQPQAHVQVVTNMIDFHLNPQEALDAPRWQWIGGKEFHVESRFPNHIIQKLVEKGHTIVQQYDDISFGRGQIILRRDDGVLVGGTESRCDGHIAAF